MGLRRGLRRIVTATALVALGASAWAVNGVPAGAMSGAGGAAIHAWGQDANGELGDGQPVRLESRAPVAVKGVSCAVSAAVTGTDSFATLADGEVDGWGADSGTDSAGLADHGSDYPYSTEPVPITGISSATAITADVANVYVLLSNGTIVGWGDNRYGQFGNGQKESEIGGSNTPTPVAKSLSGVKELAASPKGAELALMSDGEVESWGDAVGNDTLGRAGEGFEPAPVDVEGSTPMTGATSVAEGAIFSLALVGGEVKAWGDVGALNNDALGAGPKAVPGIVPVTAGGEAPLTGVSAIAAGGNFALALVKGEVKAWGSDQLGQLGDDEANEGSDLPVSVQGLSKIVAIAATEGTGYALDEAGHVWAWGNNTQGELGTGSAEAKSDVPVEIESLGAGNTGLANGEDSPHELALGPLSGSCSPTTSTTTTSSTSSTTTSSTSTSTTSTSTTTSSSTQTATPQASATQTVSTSERGSTSAGASAGSTNASNLATTEASAQLAVRCSGRKLTLTDVVQHGSHVQLDGAAASSLIGHEVEILFDGSHQVATATVGGGGQFSADAPLPPAKLRGSNGARYLAQSGGLKSLDLKLTRRLILDPPSIAGGKVTLGGEVQPPLAKPPAMVLVQLQVSCARASTVARFEPSASGRFDVTIHAPAGGEGAIYRLSTKVRGAASSSKLFSTFSLPEPVTTR
jgi:alpha-tubulin suppressor-like RCC1 family protein